MRREQQSFLLLLLGFFKFRWVLSAVSGVQCNSAYDCVNSSVSVHNDGDRIDCNGYHSCFKATKIEAISDSNIHCQGSFGCYKAQIIQIIAPSTEIPHIFCMI